jgi:hypothetical protein
MSLLDTASLIVTPNGYKEGKLYSVIPSDGSGDLSVTRATTATRVNSAGLVELVPYNLLTYSEQFDNSAWSLGFLVENVTANTATAPNGTTTADTISDTATTAEFGVGQLISSTANTPQTASIFVKANGSNFAMLRFYGADINKYYCVVANLSTGVITKTQAGSSASSTSSTINNVGNGWYRITATATMNTSDYYCIVNLVPSATPTIGDFGNSSYTGTGSNSIYIWGAQLVEGSTAKDYQKTETRLNIPRLDYSNGTCPSLLVEPQRTNLALYSSSFDTSPWIAVGTTITPNTQVAPDGTTTGDTYNTSQSILLLQTISASPSTTYTLSLWVKLGTATNLCLIANNTAAWNTIGGQSFDSSDGLNTSTWTRIEWTFTTPASLPAGAINIHLGGNSETGLTQSTGSVHIWGAQLEAGNYSTSYIPTTSASVTRNADVISKTGISSLIGQTEGTIFADFWNYDNATNKSGWNICINGGGYGNAIYFEKYLGEWAALVWNGYNNQFAGSAGGALSIGRHKMAMAYKANDIAVYCDGVLVSTDTSASIPTCSRVDIGFIANDVTPEELGLNAAALWKTRLTNDQLATLTTL